LRITAILSGLLWILPLGARTRTIDLKASPAIKLVGVRIENETYKGKPALRVTHESGEDGKSLAILPDIDFGDGRIEYEFASELASNSPALARGFVGIAFRLNPDGPRYECFYQRPLNSRVEDQERRNHSIQYISMPEFPWQKLRKETPSKYETYADMIAGDWTKAKIEVKGERAVLTINGSSQPTLIVNDLKHGASRGTLALWIDVGTVAHFANLKVTPSN
jgi:hypothetical protein